MSKPKLARRERILIISGVIVVALAILIPVVRKAQAAYDKSQAQVEQARYRLQDAQQLRMLIEAERSGQMAIRQRLAQRPSNFSLYGYTNRYLRELGLDTRADLQTAVSRMSGMEQVKLSLRGVSMEEAVDLFHKLLDNNSLVVVQKLQWLRPARDGKGLDIAMELMAPQA